jgi:hypothetical protein
MPFSGPDPFEETFRLITERALIQIVEGHLGELLGDDIESYLLDPSLPDGGRPDIIIKSSDGTITIAEVKNATLGTKPRIDDVIEQIDRYTEALKRQSPDSGSIRRALVVSGALSSEHIEYLHKRGIDQVIDGAVLAEVVARHSQPEPEPKLEPEPVPRPVQEELLGKLAVVAPGKAQWAEYQKLIKDILEYLFLPPLAKVYVELNNRPRTNRRDFILPNHATERPWAYLRNYYEAHYLVGDAKNYAKPVGKNEVLQVANYLSSHGPGLLGLIISRSPGNRSCDVTRHEQWLCHRKMILTIDDTDIRQMIAMRAANDDPAELVMQKIEDFRLGF